MAFLRLIKIIIKKYILKKRWRKCNIHNQTVVSNIFDISIVKVGAMSYGPLEVYAWQAENERLKIGNYVSIASGVKFILGGNHYYNTFSTYPFKVKLGVEEQEAYSNGPIIIEDDVWLGMDAIIMSGITIGKGAVIATGSVVTKNVLPYSIVGGNPAKVIKMRFDDDIIKNLMKIDMSRLNHEIVKDNIDLFYEDLDKVKLDKIIKIIGI